MYSTWFKWWILLNQQKLQSMINIAREFNLFRVMGRRAWGGTTFFPPGPSLAVFFSTTEEIDEGNCGSTHGGATDILVRPWGLVRFGAAGLTFCRDRARNITLSLDQARGDPLATDTVPDDGTTSLHRSHHPTLEKVKIWFIMQISPCPPCG